MVTLTLVPAAPAGVMAVMLLLLTTATLLASDLPNSTVAPLRKLEPEMVTAVPPSAGPVFGLTPVTVGEAGTAVIVRMRVTNCILFAESVTLNVSDELATDCLGVPVMAPVEAFRDKPAGRVPLVMDQVYGVVPPVAASAALYTTPTSPLGSEFVVMRRAGAVTVMITLPALFRLVADVAVSVTVAGEGTLAGAV